MVPWTSSHPGDLNFDAFGVASSSKFLGSNRIAARGLGGPSMRVASSSVGLPERRKAALGQVRVAGLGLEKVSDSF